MKEVTMYQSDAGKLHKTAEAAIKEDKLYADIRDIVGLLPPEPPFESGWGNGQVYLQCNPLYVTRAKELFVSLYNKEFSKSITRFDGTFGRLLDDSGSILYELWSTLTCIDSDNRLWGQGYYRNNPNPKATEYKAP